MEHGLSDAQRMPSCIKHVSLPSKGARNLALTHTAQTNDLCLSHPHPHPLLLLLLLLLLLPLPLLLLPLTMMNDKESESE